MFLIKVFGIGVIESWASRAVAEQRLIELNYGSLATIVEV